MVIPHNEKQSRNFHLSNTILFGVLGVLAVALGIASVSLVGFTLEFKELIRLERVKDLHAVNRVAFQKETTNLSAELGHFQARVAAYLKSSPSPGVRFQGIGGRDLSLDELTGALRQHLESRPGGASGMDVMAQEDFLRDTADLVAQSAKWAEKRKAFFALLPTLWPLPQGFGVPDRSPGAESYVKLSLVPGMPVRSSGDGTVLSVASGEGQTLTVRLDHGYGFFSEYRGLVHTPLAPKDRVKKGEALGTTGSEFTFIVQVANSWVDPLYFASVY